MRLAWRTLSVVVLTATPACDSSPTAPDGAPARPGGIRRDGSSDVCYWIGYGAGYLCPGIVAVGSPYSPPDGPYGGVFHSEPCYTAGYTCRYDPNYWIPIGSYSETGGAPEGFPAELYYELNAHERQLAWAHPLEAVRVYVAKRDAGQWAQLQSSEGAHNGIQDALRHTMWNCLMAGSIGADRAKVYADAHEESSTDAWETAMDLNNNAVGREVAGQPNTTCGTSVWAAWDQGRLITLE
ncbi:MAG TPA: hypothetical protein VFJ16_23705 [Longimicrobium sp.]|nr:hypothetical protein [Longimicrobium sp.]